MKVTQSKRAIPADLATGPWLRRDDVLSSEVADQEAVMLDVDAGAYFGVKSTAYRLWTMLQAPMSVDDLVDGLSATYPDVPVDRLRTDVHDFLSQLVASGLVRRPT